MYSHILPEWRAALTSVEAIWLAAIAVELIAGFASVRRRRVRRGALLLSAVAPTALAAVLWSGNRLLQNEWLAPFLMW